MEWTISTLSEELAKLLDRISTDLESTLVSLDGSLKDIGNGTHIKIPTGAGYVNFFKSQNNYEISIWLKEKLEIYMESMTTSLNKDDED